MSERDGMELDFSIGGDRFYVWIENVLKRFETFEKTMRTIEAAFYDSSYRKCTFLNSLSGSKILYEFFYSCNREMNERDVLF